MLEEHENRANRHDRQKSYYTNKKRVSYRAAVVSMSGIVVDGKRGEVPGFAAESGRSVGRTKTMTSADQEPQPAPSSVPPVAPPHRTPHLSFWIRELPFTLVLILTIAGVGYTSFSKRPIIGYWEILAPIIALVCVGAGWREADDKSARLRLIVTQALHWCAFLLVMNLMLLASVQRVFTTQTTALAVFTLLALGTFTAGVHVLSWQVCLLGLIMALGVPAIAWIENSALIVVLIAAAVVSLGLVLWWHWRQGRRSED